MFKFLNSKDAAQCTPHRLETQLRTKPSPSRILTKQFAKLKLHILQTTVKQTQSHHIHKNNTHVGVCEWVCSSACLFLFEWHFISKHCVHKEWCWLETVNCVRFCLVLGAFLLLLLLSLRTCCVGWSNPQCIQLSLFYWLHSTKCQKACFVCEGFQMNLETLYTQYFNCKWLLQIHTHACIVNGIEVNTKHAHKETNMLTQFVTK